MIALDLCQPHYQTLLIIYLEFTKKNAKHAWKEKKIKSECDFIGFKNNKLNYKCKECRGRYFKSINKSIKNFWIMHRFCNGDLNKFVLLLRKDVHPFKYMDSWERLNETSLLDEKVFYSELNLEDILIKTMRMLKKCGSI